MTDVLVRAFTLDRERMQRFNRKHQKFFKAVKLGEKSLQLHGSYTKSYGQFASDLDLYTSVFDVPLEKVARHIHNFLEGNQQYLFQELKVGKAKYKTLDTALKVLKDPQRLNQNLEEIKDGMKRWIKFDVFLDTGKFYEEISVIYDTGDPDLHTLEKIKKSVRTDACKYIEEGNHFKAHKRFMTLRFKPEQSIQVVQNSRYGLVSLAISHLEALMDCRLCKKDKMYLDQLKEVVKVHVNTLHNEKFVFKNVPNIIRKLKQMLNNEVPTKLVTQFETKYCKK